MGDKEHLREVIVKNYPRKKRYETELFCKRYFRQERRMYQIADEIICLSKSTKDLLCDTYKISREKSISFLMVIQELIANVLLLYGNNYAKNWGLNKTNRYFSLLVVR